MKRSARILILLASVTALIGAAALAVKSAEQRTQQEAGPQAAGTVSLTPGPRLAFRSTAPGSNGRLATVPTSDPGAQRVVSPKTCNRLYTAGGTGLCLRLDASELTTYELVVLDRKLTERTTIPLVGVPNRARVSPSGRHVAWTVFVTGDSYNGGRFSTRAGFLDTVTEELVGNLEEWPAFVDGKRNKAADRNFWGITFTPDDQHFYATMSTGGQRYLVQGDIVGKTLRTLRKNVECPSLSPDGKRIAYKSAVKGDPEQGWRLTVLDLASGRTTPLAETRSVDDQPAWIDNDSIAYGLPRSRGRSDVWHVPADGTGRPHVLIRDAESPASLSG
ncbi:TolB family protein [Streptomyces sp. NPDC003023]|uniref:TolB family protein n=1 Tax=Streptomyces sp. NPDC003023 TaxID=3364675 RepID=UPI003696A3DD